MDGNKNRVICCFCGNALEIEDSLIVQVFTYINSSELQELYSHKDCFIKLLHKSILLHPDLLDDK